MENISVNNFICDFSELGLKKLKLETPNNNNHQLIYSNELKKHILKFKLRPDELAGSLGNRIEFYYNNHDSVYSESYYLLNIMIDKSFNLNEVHTWTMLTQFHDIPGKGETWETHKPSPPPISLVLSGNKLKVVIFNRIEWKTFNLGELLIETGKWYEILWHIKWSMGEDGFVEVFVNGINITHGKQFTPTLFHFTGNTIKFGIYNNETSSELITYCSNFAIGNSPSEVYSIFL